MSGWWFRIARLCDLLAGRVGKVPPHFDNRKKNTAESVDDGQHRLYVLPL